MEAKKKLISSLPVIPFPKFFLILFISFSPSKKKLMFSSFTFFKENYKTKSFFLKKK